MVVKFFKSFELRNEDGERKKKVSDISCSEDLNVETDIF